MFVRTCLTTALEARCRIRDVWSPEQWAAWCGEQRRDDGPNRASALPLVKQRREQRGRHHAAVLKRPAGVGIPAKKATKRSPFEQPRAVVPVAKRGRHVDSGHEIRRARITHAMGWGFVPCW